MVTDDRRTDSDEDEALVARARDGDAEALNALVDRHHAVVYRVALGILRDEHGAADAAQETFLKAIRSLGSFRGEASFRTWIVTIAANEARGMLRRLGRRRETAIEESGPIPDGARNPGDQAVMTSEVERVRTALERLPEKQRLSVTLRIYDGLSFREVGEIIGSSEGSARVNYHHGIKRLRELMDDG